MPKTRYTIRLYRMHDLDLITFIETHEFNVVKAIYSSLSAFAKGEVFVIEVPPRRIQKLPPLNRSYTKALILDNETDEDAIKILNQIAPGYRNSFLKQLLRMYLCHPLSEEFFRVVKKAKDSDTVIFETPQHEVDEKSELFYQMFGIFREGKKSVKAGKLRARRSQTGDSPKEKPKEDVKPRKHYEDKKKEDQIRVQNPVDASARKDDEAKTVVSVPDKEPGIVKEPEVPKSDSMPLDSFADADEITNLFNDLI